jgi:Periplasmic protein TonB, links inner and outer membranes
LATNFGFMPVLTGKRYFISYKSEDSERIGEITRRLNEMGVPMWYDYGIEKGERWSREINANIKECEAVILFATKKLFSDEDTYVRKEFRLAKMHHKKIYVIWLDYLNPDLNPNDVNDGLEDWYVDVEELQGIRMTGKSVDQIAWSAIQEFHLMQGKKPQPPSPTFQPPVPKAEQKTVSVTQPVNQPIPATYTAPIPQQSATVTKPAPIPIFRDSVPKQEQVKPVSKKTVKHTPLIVMVAVVLVIAMVSGIWAISHSNSNPASDLTSSSSSDLTSSSSSDSTDDSTESESSEKTGSQIDISDLSGLNAVYNGEYYTFTFGNYPQGEDGEEQPIEWRVLAVEDGKALVISEKLLDYVQYNETYTAVTWETCTLRKWMNNDFFSKAFSSTQQAKIITVTNQNPNNPEYGTKGGNATQDKIFALNIDEAEKYFSSYSDRRAYTTDYAHKKGYEYSDRSAYWWLRSPGFFSNFTAHVDYFGFIDRAGLDVKYSKVAVRPAFWLNL